MPDERKPGERNSYPLEYRPVRDYIPPEHQPDPPPIVVSPSAPPAPSAPPKQTKQPIARAPRRRRRVPRPFVVSVALGVFFAVWVMGGAGFTILGFSLWGLVMGNTPPLFVLLGGVGMIAGAGWLLMLLLGWLFDELTEYRVQIVAEGTARALGELE